MARLVLLGVWHGDSPMKAVFGDEEFIVDDIDKLMRCIDFDRNS